MKIQCASDREEYLASLTQQTSIPDLQVSRFLQHYPQSKDTTLRRGHHHAIGAEHSAASASQFIRTVAAVVGIAKLTGRPQGPTCSRSRHHARRPPPPRCPSCLRPPHLPGPRFHGPARGRTIHRSPRSPPSQRMRWYRPWPHAYAHAISPGFQHARVGVDRGARGAGARGGRRGGG
jgi:hypothetical protein